MDELAEQVAEKALDEFIYDGKTLRQWVDEIVRYEEELKQNKCGECSKRKFYMTGYDDGYKNGYSKGLTDGYMGRMKDEESFAETKDAQRQRDMEES